MSTVMKEKIFVPVHEFPLDKCEKFEKFWRVGVLFGGSCGFLLQKFA
jgi:hypothetical protein